MTTPHHSEPAREAVAELLSHLNLYVMEKLETDDADMLHDRMSDVTAALSASPAPAASGGLVAVRERAAQICEEARSVRGHIIEYDGMSFVKIDDVNAELNRRAAEIRALAAPAATGGEAGDERIVELEKALEGMLRLLGPNGYAVPAGKPATDFARAVLAKRAAR